MIPAALPMPQAASCSILPTSSTSSRRWKGLDRILASWGLGVGVQRDGGKARDEHDLQVRVELGGAARQFDPPFPA